MRSFACVLALLFSSEASAEEPTAKDLFDLCVSPDPANQASCRGFIFGFYEGIRLADGAAMQSGQVLKDRPESLLCPPGNVNLAQMVSIFTATAVKLMPTYPADMQSPAPAIVFAALAKAFPCK